MLTDAEIAGIELVLADHPTARTLTDGQVLILARDLQSARRELAERSRKDVAADVRTRLVAQGVSRG